MKIIVDFSIATAMLNMIETDAHKKKETFEEHMDKMSTQEGFKKMLQFYENVFDYETYKEILFCALNNLELESKNEMIELQYNCLTRICEDIERFKKKVHSIQQFNFQGLLGKLKPTLPLGTDVDFTLFFVFDGINAASIYGDDSILLNTLFWPSEKHFEDVMVDVLLHEYHHIGIKHWLRKQGNCIDHKYENSKSFVEHLTSSILGEGAATYLFTSSSNLYPLIKESHGETVAEQFKISVERRSEDITQLLENLNHDLLDVLDNNKSSEALMELASKYSFDVSGKEPLDKTIGYHMCERIDRVLGRERLLGCFEDISRFYEQYNLTVENKNSFLFSNVLCD